MRCAQMVALGLSALLSVPDEQLPVEVRSGLPQIAHAIPKVLKALQEQQVCAVPPPGSSLLSPAVTCYCY